MQFAFKLKNEYRQVLQGAIHSDNTCRIQTVDREICPVLYSIIYEFYKLTNFPLVINTSLNSNDEPICETIKQSINCFLNLDLDFILVENILVYKSSLKASAQS
jgi:carbamoyltransferase